MVTTSSRPNWIVEPSQTLDARVMLGQGAHPMPQVMQGLVDLGPDEVFLLVTPFVPAPLVAMAEGKGYAAWTDTDADGVVMTYFVRRQGQN